MKDIFSKLFWRRSPSEKRLKTAFLTIKNEFDEHLDSINQNTNEIQANYEYICELENKVDKLTQRLDEIQMVLMTSDKDSIGNNSYKADIKKLTKREQEVFMILYTNESSNLTFYDIAKKLGLKEDMVRNYISELSSKGIPILKKFVSNKVYISIDPGFKDFQTRENVLGINPEIIKHFA